MPIRMLRNERIDGTADDFMSDMDYDEMVELGGTRPSEFLGLGRRGRRPYSCEDAARRSDASRIRRWWVRCPSAVRPPGETGRLAAPGADTSIVHLLKRSF